MAEFSFLPGDENANRVRNAWDRGYVNAASIGWVYDKETGNPEIVEVSLVAVPRDPDCLRAGYDNFMKDLFPEAEMSDKDKKGDGAQETASQPTAGVNININTGPGGETNSAKSSGGASPSATPPGPIPAEETPATAAEDQEKVEKAALEEVAKRVAARASLAVKVSGLTGGEVGELAALPQREILLKAAEHLKIEDAKDKSDDYLVASLDFSIKSNKEQRTAPTPGAPNVDENKKGKGPRIASVGGLIARKFSRVNKG